MKANVKLGRIWDIPIGVNNSWFLIFGLATWSLAMGFFPMAFPGLATAAYWLLGLVTSLLFFGSVLAHELGHAYLARRNGVPVRAITLFFFGGVAEITREPRTAGAEFRIAIAGPLVSVALAILFGLVYLLGQGNAFVSGPALWLARINLILAAFNMLPGFPLDGGRVLRAVVWQVTGSQMRATHLASRIGQLVAFGFIGFGIFSALTGDLFNGLWLVFLGFFLNSAAGGSWQQARMQQALEGVTAGQQMSRTVLRVPGWVTVGDSLDPQVLGQGHRAFLVQDFERLRGMFTLTDVRRVPRSRWLETKTEQIMVPLDRLVVVQPETEVTAALQLMQEHNIRQVPVMDVQRSEALGLLTQDAIITYLRAQSELQGSMGRPRRPSTAPGEA
jgi:Zn-dependent protease